MITDLFLFLAQTQPPAPPKPPDSSLSMLLPMIFIMVIMYFLMIRPQRKKQLELEAQIKALKNGDRVITSGGIHGTIANVRDGSSLILKVDDGVKLEVEKSAIASVLKDKKAEPASAKA
jgi:preprotein translocase subunit YajC